MTEHDIQSKLIEQLADILGLEANAIEGDTPLTDLGMDSMRFVELFIFIEKEFGVELISTDMQRADLETAQALSASIARNL